MKQIFKEKLDIIDSLYPAERVQKSKKRFDMIWNGSIPNDRYPFAFAPMLYLPYDDVHSAEQRVEATLNDLISRGVFTDDTVPSVFPGCLQTTLPNMLGAPETGEGSDRVVERIVQCPEDVTKLKIFTGKGTVIYEWLEAERKILDLTDGRLPVHICDMQGPFDASAQLCGYDSLILMAYEAPESYDNLMSLMCEAFCICWEEQKKIIGKNFIGSHLFSWDYMPQMDCASMSIDSLAMVSPDFFCEFVVPYMKKISERLGKLVIHSCGDFGHNIKALMEEDIVIGINASQMTVEQMMEKGLTNDKVVIIATDGNVIADSIKTCRENKMLASLSAYGPYPLGSDGATWIHSDNWTQKDREFAMELNQKLLDAATVKK